jgi:sugar phosphate isomerase/epimerase
MAFRNNAKIGFVGFTAPAPKEYKTPFEKAKWQLDFAHEMGCELAGVFTFGMSDDEVKQINEIKDKYGLEAEGFMPGVVFQLNGWQKMSMRGEPVDKVKALEDFEAHCAKMKESGVKITRGAYGRLCYPFSRWNRDPEMTGKMQMENLIECYKIADPILEKYDLYFAQENHLDFKGSEFDYMFRTAGVKRIGSAYDTANGFYVNCDANDDIPYLSKWAITTHIKDTKIVDSPFNGPDGPMIAVGCGLGEGNVDVPAALEAIFANSPMKDGIHLIFESGWYGKACHDANPDMDAYNRMKCRESLEWLKDYITIK